MLHAGNAGNTGNARLVALTFNHVSRSGKGRARLTHPTITISSEETFGPTRFTTVITMFGKMASLYLFIPGTRGKEFLLKILES